MIGTLGVALTAGMLATVNPCGFAMLPGYLTMVVRRSLGRALAAAGLMTAGFVVVFAAFGAVIGSVSAIQRYLPLLTVLIGLAMAVAGVFLLLGKDITLPLAKPKRGAPDGGLLSMFGYGLAYALVSLSCTLAPFLAVTGVALRGEDLLAGMAAFLAYALGMGLVVAVLAVAAALAGDAVQRGARRVLPYVGRIGGALLIIAGLYVFYYGLYELRLSSGADASDPVIDTALRVQGALADLVGAIGPVPLLITLAVLVAAVLLLRQRLRR